MWECSHQCSWCTPHPNWPQFQPFQLPECPQPDPLECDAGSPCQTGSWTQPGLQDCSIAPRTAKWWQKLWNYTISANATRIFWDDPPELQPGCYSELYPHQLMSGYNGPSGLKESLPGVLLPWSHSACSWNRLYWSPAAVYGGDDEVRQLWGDKNRYSQINHYYSNQEILHLTVLAKVQVLVNVIRNRIRSWRPHLRLAISAITMKPATWKKLFCNPEYKKKKAEMKALPLKEDRISK